MLYLVIAHLLSAYNFQEDEAKNHELEADKDRMMREYRAQLDAERAKKLAHGRNHSSNKSHRTKGEKKGNPKLLWYQVYGIMSQSLLG